MSASEIAIINERSDYLIQDKTGKPKGIDAQRWKMSRVDPAIQEALRSSDYQLPDQPDVDDGRVRILLGMKENSEIKRILEQDIGLQNYYLEYKGLDTYSLEMEEDHLSKIVNLPLETDQNIEMIETERYSVSPV